MAIITTGSGGTVQTVGAGLFHLTGTNASVPANASMEYVAWIIARDVATGATASFQSRGNARRLGAAAAVILGQGFVVPALKDPALTASNATLGLLGNNLGVWMAGVAGLTIQWEARVLNLIAT